MPRNNKFIDQANIRSELLGYVYDTINLSRLNYKILEYGEDLQMLNEKKYFIAPNYTGSNCLLVFIRLRDKYFSFFVDRKTLTYSFKSLNLNKVKIYPVEYNLTEEIYKGTIFDGILLPEVNGQRTYMIYDTYRFLGNDMLNDKLDYKMINISTYLSTFYHSSPTARNGLAINELHGLFEIDRIISQDTHLAHIDFIKGLVFYPEVSGTKLIFMYPFAPKQTDMSQQKFSYSSRKGHEEYQHTSKKSFTYKDETSSISMPNKKINLICRMKKTGLSDVYKLYLEKKRSKGKIFYKKIGMASILTLDKSKFCNELMKKKTSVFVKCSYNPKTKNLIPEKKSKKKYIDNIEKLS
jgi:hypothetical protein